VYRLRGLYIRLLDYLTPYENPVSVAGLLLLRPTSFSLLPPT
jgi:hypothetical protein